MTRAKIFRTTRSNLPELLRKTYQGAFRKSADQYYGDLAKNEVAVGFWSEYVEPNQFPDFLLINEASPREFFAWIVTYLPSAAPITQWCRVFAGQNAADFISDEAPNTGLRNSIHGWAGAIIGECVAQTGRADARSALNYSACLATYTYAAAKALSIWGGRYDWPTITSRIDKCHALFGLPARRVRNASLVAVWEALSQLDNRTELRGPSYDPISRVLARCIQDISITGRITPAAINQLIDIYPDAISVGALEDMSSEQRVLLFEAMNKNVVADKVKDDKQRRIIEFCLAYIASNVGGGWRNIELTLEVAQIAPLAPVWFGIIHSFTDTDIYGAVFNGLSRLVLRDLETTFRLRERPRADIALDELEAMLPGQDRDGIFTFKTVNPRSATIELLPGIVTAVSLDARRETELSKTTPASHKSTSAAPLIHADKYEVLAADVAEIRRALIAHGIMGSAQPPGLSDPPASEKKISLKRGNKTKPAKFI